MTIHRRIANVLVWCEEAKRVPLRIWLTPDDYRELIKSAPPLYHVTFARFMGVIVTCDEWWQQPSRVIADNGVKVYF